MVAQQVRVRPQASAVEFSAGNRVAESVARGFVYRELALRLTGQLGVTAVNNTQANTLRGDEWGVVKKIELIANGTDVIKVIAGDDLWWLNYHLYGRAPKIEPTIGDATTLNPSFDSVILLPLWIPRSIRPLDTALDSKNLSSLEIAVTWGTFTDINSAATSFVTPPQVEINSLESFNFKGNLSSWRLFPIEKEITASNPRFEIELPVGKLFRAFQINTRDAGVDQGDILNNFKLVSGTTVFADIKAGGNFLQQVSKLRGGLNPDPVRRSLQSSIDGQYFIDLVTDGFMSEAIDTLGFSEFKIEADVTVGGGTTKILVHPYEIVPVRGGPNNG